MCNCTCCKRETEAWSQQKGDSQGTLGPTLLGELAGSQPHRGQAGVTGDTPKQASPSLCLCQFDLKERRSFFGQRKDYWDFLCQGLAQRRQEHEGIRFVTSLDKVGTGWHGAWGLTHAHVCTLLLVCGCTHTCIWAHTHLGTEDSPTSTIKCFLPSGVPTAPQPWPWEPPSPLHGLGGRYGGADWHGRPG